MQSYSLCNDFHLGTGSCDNRVSVILYNSHLLWPVVHICDLRLWNTFSPIFSSPHFPYFLFSILLFCLPSLSIPVVGFEDAINFPLMASATLSALL